MDKTRNKYKRVHDKSSDTSKDGRYGGSREDQIRRWTVSQISLSIKKETTDFGTKDSNLRLYKNEEKLKFEKLEPWYRRAIYHKFKSRWNQMWYHSFMKWNAIHKQHKIKHGN